MQKDHVTIRTLEWISARFKSVLYEGKKVFSKQRGLKTVKAASSLHGINGFLARFYSCSMNNTILLCDVTEMQLWTHSSVT